ncbi:holo-ACP synthase [Salibacterium aidingense]|uniref:holo-ACP synthase n=1 Tax=Salibacterium aidingense TaxID=384933 RepID=UPI0003F8C5F6|nr:holo-ACP synthase [Salibacterium aidingense]
MVRGIGIDIVELARIERLLLKNDRFEKRVLTPAECRKMKQYQGKRKIEYTGGRFAAKEAFVKAAGTGISTHYSFQDLEITSDENGKPCLEAAGWNGKIHVSISHSQEYAVAQVVLE